MDPSVSVCDDPDQWESLMLDRFVFTMDAEYDGSHDLSDFVAEAGPTWDRSITSLGEYFAVGLIPVTPPKVSRLYVQWSSGEGKAMDKVMEVVTADRGLFLLRVTTSTVLDSVPYRQDYFVYRAAMKPLLRRLPMCMEQIVLPQGDSEVTMRRVFHNNTLALVSRINSEEEFEFMVAQLAKFDDIPGESRKKRAEVCVFRSSKSNVSLPRTTAGSFAEVEGMWEILTLPIHHTEEEFSDLQGWSTDGAIILNGFICWFDYYHGGMLFFAPSRGFIEYVRLPINNRPIHSLPSDKKFEMYRSLSVTGSRGHELLCFVDVARDDKNFYGPLWKGYTFTITCYFLRQAHLEWQKYPGTTSKDLYRLDANKLMPRNSVPTFPLVSRKRNRLIHFLLSEPGKEIDKVSVVGIDIEEQAIVSVTPYIKGDEDLCGKDAEMVRHRSRLPWSFLPFEF